MKKHALILGLALLSGACVHHNNSRHPHGLPPGQAKKVVHSHGHNCGHVHVEGHWVVETSTHGHGSGRGKGHKK